MTAFESAKFDAKALDGIITPLGSLMVPLV
jgi:hypothetical protein